MTSTRPSPTTQSEAATATEKILAALRGLRFGSIEIVVHEGRIVQIERKEKLRLNLSFPEGAGADTGR